MMQETAYTEPDDAHISAYSRLELMGQIAFKLGYKPRRQMTKQMVNSAIAYLTGEYHKRPDEVSDATAHELRKRLANEVGFVYLQTEDWFDAGGDFDRVRPYRWSELRAIVQAFRESGDMRSWAVSNRTPDAAET